MKPVLWREFFLPGALSILAHAALLFPWLFLIHGPVPSLATVAVARTRTASQLPVVDLQEDGEWRKPSVEQKQKVLVVRPTPQATSLQEPGPSGAPPAIVNDSGEYLSIGQVSQRPGFKVKVIPSYPEAAKRANIEGVVILQVDIDASGAVKKVGLIKGLGYGCDEAAIDALKKSVLTPAYLGTQAVPVRQMPLKYNFHFDY